MAAREFTSREPTMPTMRTSIFQICSILAAVVLVSLSGLLQPAFALPSSSSCDAVDRLTIALRFAQVLFPELKGGEFSVTLSSGNGGFASRPTDTSDFRIRFDKPIWHPTVNGKLQPNTEQSPSILGDGVELPFDLYFSFIETHSSAKQRKLACHPLNFTSTAGYKQMEKVWSTIDPHPEWSDEEELRVARKLGLRYGPEDKSAILKKLPLKELSKFYGPLRIKSARFSMNVGKKCTGCSFVNPTWEITLSGSGTRSLLIIVEPFFGKITSISE
jgi:hypothetical protein